MVSKRQILPRPVPPAPPTPSAPPAPFAAPELPSLDSGQTQDVIRALLEKGAKLPKANVILKEGSVINQTMMTVTTLHTAVAHQDLDLIDLLLSRDACMMTWNEYGDTALHLAVRLELLEPLKKMLCREVPWPIVDVRDIKGQTPLHLAVKQQWAEGVSFLLEMGADVKTTSNDSERAVVNNHLTCVELLCEYNADVSNGLPGDYSLVHIAAENNFPEIVSFLLRDRRVGYKLRDSRCRQEKGGLTPLHLAARAGHTPCVEELLKAGANLLLTTTEEPMRSSTALHLAAREGFVETVQTILDFDLTKQTLKATDEDKWYPLHVAAMNGHGNCVRVMLRHGADIAAAIPDETGLRSGLEIIMYCVPQAVEFLVEIFDSYIENNKRAINDPECEIEVKYDILIPEGTSKKQMGVLNELLNNGRQKLQEELLLHPIVETFVWLKWRKLRGYFFCLMAFFFIFTLSLTSLSILHYVIKKYYLRDYESGVKWFVFLGTWAVGIMNPGGEWARFAAAVTVLLAWTELLFLLSRCPSWGFYALMFSKVAKNVLSTFTFIIVGFAFSFMILNENLKEPFHNFWHAIVKVLIMMIEPDYGDTFENTLEINVISQAIFVTFVILISIVLMNLMVGLAVSDISILEAQGRTERLAKQIGFLSLLELLVYNDCLIKCLPKCLRIALEKRRCVSPSVIIRPATPLNSVFQQLPRDIRESVLEKVAAQLSKANAIDVKECLQKLDNEAKKHPKDVKKTSFSNSSHLSRDSTVTEKLYDNEIKMNLKAIMKEIAELRNEVRGKRNVATEMYRLPQETTVLV
ncbi:hypothetical protein AAG570_008977 [Ranatra chinensis]|uniref:Ion transport domain-containing protein n=1 Tax=Ranatra chinensis TaxID=642074 RepID=A0ABD0YSH4_9HEMI